MKIFGYTCLIIGLACVFVLLYLAHHNSTGQKSKKSSSPTVNVEPRNAKFASNKKTSNHPELDLINKVDKLQDTSDDGTSYRQRQNLFMAHIQYNGVLPLLSLSKEDEATLMHLLTERGLVGAGVRLAVGRGEQLEKSEAEKAEQSLRREFETGVDADIYTLLGEEKFAIFEKFQQTQSFRTFVQDMASRLSYTSAAVSPQQAGIIADYLSQNTDIINPNDSQIYYDIILKAPTEVVSDAQKKRILRLQQEDADIKSLDEELRKQRSATKKKPDP